MTPVRVTRATRRDSDRRAHRSLLPSSRVVRHVRRSLHISYLAVLSLKDVSPKCAYILPISSGELVDARRSFRR